MPASFDLGDKAPLCLDCVVISVDPKQADSVVVKNVAGDTLSYFGNLTSSAAGTLTATNSATFTQPVWLQSAGRTSVLLTGGKY